MSVTRSIYAPNLDMEALIQALVAWYRSQNLEVEQLPSQSVMLQCRERQAWRKFVGMAMGLHVELNYSDPGLTVTISAGKWADKAIVGGIAVATMASGIGLPLAIPAAFGYWQQRKLPDRTFAFIEEAIASQRPPNHAPASSNPQIGFPMSPPTPAKRPGGNGQSNPMEADGTPDANIFLCPVCGTANQVTASFCRGCGTRLESDLEESAFKMKSTRGDSSMPGNANFNRSPGSANDSAPGSGSTMGSASTTSNAVACPKCGKLATPGKRFCGECGSPLNRKDASGTNVDALANATASKADSMKSTGPTASERTALGGVALVIDHSGQRINVPNKREVVIGRRDTKKNFFPDLDLTPHKGEACGVSLEHAQLLLQNGRVMLEDLDAPNCTWLGDEQLLPRTPRPLRNGDKIRFGKLTATVFIP